MLKRLFALFFGEPLEESLKDEIEGAVTEANEEVQQFLADPGALVPQYNDLGVIEKAVVDGVLVQMAIKGQEFLQPYVNTVYGKVEAINPDVAEPAPLLQFVPAE